MRNRGWTGRRGAGLRVVWIAAVAAAGVLGLLLAGCGGAAAPAEGTALEPEAFPMEAAKLAEAPASAPEMDLAAAAGAEDGFLAERKEEAAGALADASSGNLALSPAAARAGDAPAAAPEATAAPAKPGAAPEAAAPGGVEAAARLATRDGHRTRAPQLLARLDTPDLEPLPAVSSDISVVIVGHRARVVLDLVFRNPSDRQLAGTLMVALPNGASPCYLGMFQGEGSRGGAGPAGAGPQGDGEARGRWLNPRPPEAGTLLDRAIRLESGWQAAGGEVDWGELRPARVVKPDTGRAVYESVTRRRVDPALGEWAGSGRYSARIFPIPPGGLKRVVFAYDQTLPAAGGSVLYPLPLPAELPPAARVTVHDLSPAAVDAALVAGDRTLAGRRTNRGRVWGFEPEAGFRGSLVYTAGQSRPEIQLLVGRDPAIPGKLVHLRVTPPLTARRGPAATGRALFLLDTSRSGKERLWSLSGRLLRAILERDESISAFALLAFDVQPYPLTQGFTANTPAGREKLLADVERIRLEGATSFESVLERLAADGRLAEADTVFLLSDGAITWGEDDPGRLQSRFPGLLAKRWICYAPAEAPHNEALFRALTRSGGQVVGVAVGQDPAAAADAHRSSFSRLTALHTARQDELLLPGGRPERLYPGQVLEIGAVLPEDRREIELLLGIDGETVRIAAPLAEIPEAEAIAARAWADLYARLLAGRPDEGAVEAIQRLSGHFSLTNSHASFIILETDEEYGQHGIIESGLDYPALRRALKYATGAPVPGFPDAWLDADTGRLLASLEQVPLRPAWRTAPLRKAEADASLLLAPPAYEPAGDAPRKIHALARELAAVSLPAAYRVLSSVAEVSPTDDQALRLVGFQLMEWAMYGEAEDLFARVRRRRPFEPQNALLEAVALAAMGRAREAALRYEYVLRTDFPRFADSARPVAGRLYADLLRSLLAADGGASEGGSRAAGGGPDAELWRRRLAELDAEWGGGEGDPGPAGRLVLLWNLDDTDVDLHVRESALATVSYENMESATGGRLFWDNTDGLGPELYEHPALSRQGFQVFVNYFGSSSVEGAAPAATFVACFTRDPQGGGWRASWYTTVLAEVEKEKVPIMPLWKRP